MTTYIEDIGEGYFEESSWTKVWFVDLAHGVLVRKLSDTVMAVFDVAAWCEIAEFGDWYEISPFGREWLVHGMKQKLGDSLASNSKLSPEEQCSIITAIYDRIMREESWNAKTRATGTSAVVKAKAEAEAAKTAERNAHKVSVRVLLEIGQDAAGIAAATGQKLEFIKELIEELAEEATEEM